MRKETTIIGRELEMFIINSGWQKCETWHTNAIDVVKYTMIKLEEEKEKDEPKILYHNAGGYNNQNKMLLRDEKKRKREKEGEDALKWLAAKKRKVVRMAVAECGRR